MTSTPRTRPLPSFVAQGGASVAAKTRRTLFAILWCALVLLVTACGGRALSTDTGNPSVNETRIHVAATDTGVLVTGDPGAVSPGGATVLVTNDTTDDSVTTTAESDGSFQAEIAGTVDDDIRVEAAAPPLDLQGVWSIESAMSDDGGMLLTDPRLGEVTFSSNGRFSVQSLCNGGGGSYRIDSDERITLSGTTFGDEECPTLELGDLIIRDVLIDITLLVTLEDGLLTLSTGHGLLNLRFLRNAPPGPIDTSLDGRSFLLESAEGYEVVEGTTVRLSFEDGQLSFSAGCNGYSSPYSLCDGGLCTEEFGSTNIGCDANLHEQDQEFAALLSAMPFLDLAGDRLTLRNNDAEPRRCCGFTLVFVDSEVANPDRPLQGGTWTIDTLIEGGAAMGINDANFGTLSFASDGTVNVQTVCNGGSGSFTVTQGVLSLSDMSYTEAGCPDAVAAFQSQVMAVMTNGDVTFTIEANRLTIMRGDIGLSATTE